MKTGYAKLYQFGEKRYNQCKNIWQKMLFRLSLPPSKDGPFV
jgi:hypothetical protein